MQGFYAILDDRLQLPKRLAELPQLGLSIVICTGANLHRLLLSTLGDLVRLGFSRFAKLVLVQLFGSVFPGLRDDALSFLMRLSYVLVAFALDLFG